MSKKGMIWLLILMVFSTLTYAEIHGSIGLGDSVKYFTKENSHKSYEDLKNELRRYYEDTCDYNIKSLTWFQATRRARRNPIPAKGLKEPE